MGAVVVLALLFVSPSTATRPNTTIHGCQSMSASAFRFWSASVWNAERWSRGRPPAAVIASQRRKLRCATPGVRTAARRRWALDERAYFHERHRCRSGQVISGRVSYFGGGLMASGHYTSEPAIALNVDPGSEAGWDNATTRGWLLKLQRFRVTIAGHSAVLFVGDLGPAGFTDRAIDVTEGGVEALGLGGIFPTDAVGTAKLIPAGC